MCCRTVFATVAFVALCSSAQASPLPDDLLVRVIRERVATLSACYELDARTGAARSDKAFVSLSIAETGEVTHAGFETELASAGLRECVRQRVESWIFPQFESGPKEIRYPLVYVAR